MLQGLTILLFVIAAAIYLLDYLMHGGRKGKLMNQIPGPPTWPIIGNMVDFMVPLDQLWVVLHSMSNKYYPIYRTWQANVAMVHIFHPDDVEILLSSTKHIEKSEIYECLQPWLGTGLLTSTGKKWHQRRKILTPAFHFGMLQKFVGVFIEQSNKLVESLCPDGEQVIENLVSLLHQYTINSIRESAMGSTSSSDVKILNEYTSCVSEMGDLILYRITKPWLIIDWLFRCSVKFVDQCRVLDVLHGFTTRIINERKQYHNDTGGQYLKGLDSVEGIYDFDGDDVNGKRRLAMLDLLISASHQDDGIDDDGIREEVDTFVFEAHDTTAAGLCYALMLLAENKEIQDKARAEVDGVFGGKKGDEFSIKDLQRLSYLERCIKESLRLFPSVPFISRKLFEDLQLKNYLVPSGTVVHVHIWDLHRDPNFWPNPNVFDPDRFSPDQMQGRHPFAFAPFSAGPRNCIGQKFAMLESKALIANVLHKFYLEPIDKTDELRFTTDLILRPVTPARIKFVRRTCHD